MILTNNTKARFEEWLEQNSNTPWVVFFYQLPETVQHAYIVEWLDSVGIPIVATKGIGIKKYWAYRILIEDEAPIGTNFIYPSRTEALKASIIKADLIFNERNK